MHRILAIPLLWPVGALAHDGALGASSFVEGASHPLGGLDHLLAMVAVGLWAAIAGGRARWAYPSAFLGGMIAGGALGLAGVAPPAVEPAILASVVAIGAVGAFAARLPVGLACAGLAFLGAAHGDAHGLESTTGGVGFVLGFTLATAALHGAGYALGTGARSLRAPALARVAAGAAALAGVALAFG